MSGNLDVGGTITASGDVSAPSFNNLQIFSANQPTVIGHPNSCDEVCVANGGSCLSAKQAIIDGGIYSAVVCANTYANGNSLHCYCAKF